MKYKFEFLSLFILGSNLGVKETKMSAKSIYNIDIQ
jgi:hypothetical protein